MARSRVIIAISKSITKEEAIFHIENVFADEIDYARNVASFMNINNNDILNARINVEICRSQYDQKQIDHIINMELNHILD